MFWSVLTLLFSEDGFFRAGVHFMFELKTHHILKKVILLWLTEVQRYITEINIWESETGMEREYQLEVLAGVTEPMGVVLEVVTMLV